jgi:tryptophan synthase beta subunit
LLCRTEGIIPALEPSHAIYHSVELAAKCSPDTIILLGLSGRGDKDMMTVADALGVEL